MWNKTELGEFDSVGTVATLLAYLLLLFPDDAKQNLTRMIKKQCSQHFQPPQPQPVIQRRLNPSAAYKLDAGETSVDVIHERFHRPQSKDLIEGNSVSLEHAVSNDRLI